MNLCFSWTPFEMKLATSWNFKFLDLKESQNINKDEYLYLDQVHSSRVHYLSNEDKFKESPLASADIFAVEKKTFKNINKPLLIKTADCLPIVMLDKKQEKAALVHAGWRGLARGAHRVLIDQGFFLARELSCYVGPSLNGKYFEVAEDLRQQFPKYKDNGLIFKIITGSKGKFYFYPWKLVELEFRELNVAQINISNTSTYANKAYASYRRSCHQRRPLDKEQRNFTILF